MTPEELLKEVGEPVSYQERQQTNDGFTEWYDAYAGADICGQGSKVCGGIEYQWRGLYTSDQVAAAILKVTKPLEERLSWLDYTEKMNKALGVEIEELTTQLAKAEQRVAEVERLSVAHVKACQANADSQAELAAEQLNSKRLRDALQEYIDEHEECQDADDWMAMMCSVEAHHAADEALSQPSDTSALDSFVAERVKEYQERLADALAVLGADSQIEAEAVMLNYKKQVSTLTKQRDLAVEAASDAATSLETIQLRSFGEESYLDSKPQMRAFAGARAKIARDIISTIKESEAK